jgi:uncharacterized membrane protein
MGSSNQAVSRKMKLSPDPLSIEALSMESSSIEGAFDDTFRSGRRERTVRLITVGVGLTIALAVIVLLGGRAHLHLPDLSLLADQPLVLKLHIAGAITALTIGTVLMFGPKGTTFHRTLGWTWVLAMLTTAVSTFFFPAVLKGHLSPIHALSAYVAIAVPMGVAFARRHDIRAHRRMMTGNFLFGLIVAGAFTFVPGRLMWRVFFG